MQNDVFNAFKLLFFKKIKFLNFVLLILKFKKLFLKGYKIFCYNPGQRLKKPKDGVWSATQLSSCITV